MSSVISTIKQIRFPAVSVADSGATYQIIINRNCTVNSAVNLATTDILYLGGGLPALTGTFGLSRKEKTEDGRTATDAVHIDIIDSVDYSGKVNGVTVGGDVPSRTTALNEFFNDEVNAYGLWVLWTLPDGSHEYSFTGHYSASYKPREAALMLNEGTPEEEAITVRSTMWAEGAELLANTPFSVVRSAISFADCTLGQFYNGFMSPPSGDASQFSHYTRPVFPSEGTGFLMQAVPHVHQYAAGSLTTANRGTSFPAGTWGISLHKVLGEIALACGFNYIVTLDSAFEMWQQQPSTDRYGIASTPVALSDYQISYNVWFGYHPYTGLAWDNPLAWKDANSCMDVLGSICKFLGCGFKVIPDATTGVGAITLVQLGATPAAIPSSLVGVGTPKEAEPYSGPSHVSVHNKGDNLKVIAPYGIIGDAVEIEIPFRLKRWGSPLAPSAYSVQAVDAMWDAAFDLNGQADECFKIAWIDGSGNVVVNNNCWKGLAGLYLFNHSNTNLFYDSSWTPFDSATWADSFYALGFQTKAGTSHADAVTQLLSTNSYDYFSSRNYQAVANARYQIPKATLQERDYSGVTGDDGMLSSFQIGCTGTRNNDGDNSSIFRVIEINLTIGPDGTTSTTRQQNITGGNFPALTDIPFGPEGTTGGTSTSGGGTTSSSGGAGNAAAISSFVISGGSTGLNFTPSPLLAPGGTVTVGGTLVVANGGTGLASLTAHSTLVGNGTGTATLVAPSTSGFVYTSNGGAADPSFQALPASGVTSIATNNGVTGGTITSTGTIGLGNWQATGSALFGIGSVCTNSGLGSVVIGNQQSATGSYAGVYSGQVNSADGVNSVVVGGFTNTAHGGSNGAAVLGGGYNMAYGSYTAILGGSSNTAGTGVSNGIWSAILGGKLNQTSNDCAAIVGGASNTVNGLNAVAIGGLSNGATGMNQSVTGQYNFLIPATGQSSWNASYPILIGGNGTGTATNQRSNSFWIDGNSNFKLGGKETGGANGTTGTCLFGYTGSLFTAGVTLALHSASRTYTLLDQTADASFVMATGTLASSGVLVGSGTGTLVNQTAAGTTGTVLRGQTGTTPVFGAVNLTTDVTGVLPVANGGAGTVQGALSSLYGQSALGAAGATVYSYASGYTAVGSALTGTNVNAVAYAQTIARLYVILDSAPGLGQSVRATLYKNGVSTALTCLVSGAIANTANDTTHSVTFAAGDVMTVEYVRSVTAVSTSSSHTFSSVPT